MGESGIVWERDQAFDELGRVVAVRITYLFPVEYEATAWTNGQRRYVRIATTLDTPKLGFRSDGILRFYERRTWGVAQLCAQCNQRGQIRRLVRPFAIEYGAAARCVARATLPTGRVG